MNYYNDAFFREIDRIQLHNEQNGDEYTLISNIGNLKKGNLPVY